MLYFVLYIVLYIFVYVFVLSYIFSLVWYDLDVYFFGCLFFVSILKFNN